MGYRLITNDGVLEHSAKGSSWEKKDHKYIKKYKNENGKTVYVYANKKNHDQIELDLRDIEFDSEVASKIEEMAKEYDYKYLNRTDKTDPKYSKYKEEYEEIVKNAKKIRRNEEAAKRRAYDRINEYSISLDKKRK